MKFVHSLFKGTSLLIRFFLSVAVLSLLMACTPVNDHFKTTYDPEYRTIDRGGINAVVSGGACSRSEQEAVRAARKAAEYNLRTVIGGKRYLVKVRNIRVYREGGSICADVTVGATDPFLPQ